jgi:hypothetical protein
MRHSGHQCESLGKLLEDSLWCYLGVQRVDYLASEGALVANQKVARFRCSPMPAWYGRAMRTLPRCVNNSHYNPSFSLGSIISSFKPAARLGGPRL